MGNISLATYKSVYALGLDELIWDDELRNVLLVAESGSLGENLRFAIQTIKEKTTELFTPRSRSLPLNQALADWREANQDVRILSRRPAELKEKKENLVLLEREADEIEKTISELTEEQIGLNSLLESRSLWENLCRLQNQVQKLDYIRDFPPSAVDDFTRAKKAYNEAIESEKQAQEQKEQAERELSRLEIDDDLLKMDEKLRRLGREAERLHDKPGQLRDAEKRSISARNEARDLAAQYCGPQTDIELLRAIDTSATRLSELDQYARTLTDAFNEENQAKEEEKKALREVERSKNAVEQAQKYLDSLPDPIDLDFLHNKRKEAEKYGRVFIDAQRTKKQAEEDFQQANLDLSRAREELEQAEKQLKELPLVDLGSLNNRRARLENWLRLKGQEHSLEEQKQNITERLSELRSRKQREEINRQEAREKAEKWKEEQRKAQEQINSNERRRRKIASLGIGISMAVIGIILLVMGENIGGVVSIVGGIVFILLTATQSTLHFTIPNISFELPVFATVSEEDICSTEEKLQECENKLMEIRGQLAQESEDLGLPENPSEEFVRQLIDQINQEITLAQLNNAKRSRAEVELDTAKRQLGKAEHDFQNCKEKLEKAQSDLENAEKQWIEWLKSNGFPGKTSELEDILSQIDEAITDAQSNQIKRAEAEAKLSEAKRQLENAEDYLRNCEERVRNVQSKVERAMMNWSAWLNSIGFPERLSVEGARSYFDGVRKVQEKLRESEVMSQLAESLKNDLQLFREKINSVAKELDRSIIDDDPWGIDTARFWAEEVNKQRELVGHRDNWQEKLYDAQIKLEKAREKKIKAEKTMKEILQRANAEDEDDLIKRSEDFNEFMTLTRKLREKEAALRSTRSEEEWQTFQEKLRNVNWNYIQEEIQKIDQMLREKHGERDNLMEKIGQLKSEIENLQKESALVEAQQKREEAETKVKQLGQEWASQMAAYTLLLLTRKRFEQDRQPETIKRTAKLFSRLTANRWHSIVSRDDKLTALREEEYGSLEYDPEKLSRSAKESLFLCARLAAIERAVNRHPLPVVLDDILVNLDLDRRKRMIEIITELADKTQLFLLTCHDHLIEDVKSIEVNFNLVEISQG
jgi:uncharacterized protein YhaN